ncbi:MAG TPA: hypothetical protein VGR22_00365 [Thermomicrobiales bacterium]|nr:hypothetical protein [Thermomicrobiales bacterium]
MEHPERDRLPERHRLRAPRHAHAPVLLLRQPPPLAAKRIGQAIEQRPHLLSGDRQHKPRETERRGRLRQLGRVRRRNLRGAARRREDGEADDEQDHTTSHHRLLS